MPLAARTCWTWAAVSSARLCDSAWLSKPVAMPRLLAWPWTTILKPGSFSKATCCAGESCLNALMKSPSARSICDWSPAVDAPVAYVACPMNVVGKAGPVADAVEADGLAAPESDSESPAVDALEEAGDAADVVDVEEAATEPADAPIRIIDSNPTPAEAPDPYIGQTRTELASRGSKPSRLGLDELERGRLHGDQRFELLPELLERHAGQRRELGQLVRIVEIVAA